MIPVTRVKTEKSTAPAKISLTAVPRKVKKPFPVAVIASPGNRHETKLATAQLKSLVTRKVDVPITTVKVAAVKIAPVVIEEIGTEEYVDFEEVEAIEYYDEEEYEDEKSNMEKVQKFSIVKASESSNSSYKLEMDEVSQASDDAKKNFACRHCGKRYRWKSTLRRHETVECGGKQPSYGCPYCDYKAKQHGNLGVHVRKHHTDQPQLASRRKSQRK